MCIVLESVAALVRLIVMVSGIFISLVRVNVLGLWVGLEVNFLGAICFIAGDTVKESEGVIKYFIIQVVGSCFLLLGILTLVNWGFLNFRIFIVLSGSLIKLGCFPFHFWVPTVISGLSWSGCFTLSVIQKIIPLWFLSRLMLSGWETFIIEVISCLSCVVGCLGGLGVLNYRVILAYSSFVHLGFILILTFVRVSSFWLYLIIYGLVNFFIIISLASLDVYSFIDLIKEKNYIDLDNI